ncbi:MAG: YIP1 family protein [Gammaproteobacteria bacterium]|nr:YIP1 family protein [Gammaproteobacteria bacterium]MDH5345370.1 YIP1 family protein [Gammaproteobacteria bacterium]
MFDFNRTLALVKGAIFDPDATWAGYRADAEDWQKTALLLTAPLIVGSRVLYWLFDLVLPNRFDFIGNTTILETLVGIVIAAVAAGIIAFLVALFAGLFKGKNSFPLALAATTLAFVPGYVGAPLSHIPWIGWLLSLALGIYGLVLLWRILPGYLEVPDASRTGHYLLSIVSAIGTMLVLGAIFGAGAMGGSRSGFDFGSVDGAGSGAPAGMFGDFERQGQIMEAAGEDTYDPPRDGELSRKQVAYLVEVLEKTKEANLEQARKLEEMAERAEKNESASLAEAMSGMSGLMGMATTEMEVVKTGGGNWAEHQWVKEQLYVARLQKDISDAVKHNYELYLEFEEELEALDF